MEEIRLDLSEEELQKLEEIKNAAGHDDIDLKTFIKEYASQIVSDNIIAWDWKDGDMERHKLTFK